MDGASGSRRSEAGSEKEGPSSRAEAAEQPRESTAGANEDVPDREEGETSKDADADDDMFQMDEVFPTLAPDFVRNYYKGKVKRETNKLCFLGFESRFESRAAKREWSKEDDHQSLSLGVIYHILWLLTDHDLSRQGCCQCVLVAGVASQGFRCHG